MIRKKSATARATSTKPPARSQARAALLLAIEPRMLFDGAALASTDALADLHTHALAEGSADRTLDVGVKPISMDSAALPVANFKPLELVVIDPNVKDWQVLAAGLSPNVQLLVLDPQSDALVQIAQTMSEVGQYSAVHLISHGQSEGRVVFGNRILNSDSLSQYAAELSRIGEHLTADGDLLLYGCDIGDGPAGAGFLQALAQATRADVAASNDNTGGKDAGGNWVLEASTGAIESRLPIDARTLSDYGRILPATPDVSLAGGGVTLIGENFTLSATFSNPGTIAGYGPYVDLFVPARGIDGGASPDGVTITGASYLGAPLAQTSITLSAADILAGQVAHPYFTDSTGAHGVSIPVGFQAGDQLIVFQLPFGSFTPGQPGAEIQIAGTLSSLADVGGALNFSARGGFQYGNDALSNPAVDPSIQGGLDTLAITPALYRLTTTYIGLEDETATGPNFARAYRIDVDLAPGQTLSNVDLSSVLSSGMQYLPVSGTPAAISGIGLGAAPAGGWTNVNGVLLSGSGTSIATPGTTVPGGTLTRELASVTGTGSTIDASMVVQFYVPLQDSGNVAILDAVNGDAVDLTVGSALTGTWTPADARDPGNQAISESVAVAHTLTAHSISSQKTGAIVTNAGGAQLSPGDVVRYTLESQISDYFAFGGNVSGLDLSIVDTLSDGQMFLDSTTSPSAADPVMVVNRNGGTESYSLTSGVNYSIALNGQGQQVITFNLRSALPAAGNGQLLIGDLFADALLSGGTTVRLEFLASILDSYRTMAVDAGGNPVAGSLQLDLNEGDYVANRESISGTVLDSSLDPSAAGLLTEADTSGIVLGLGGNPVSIVLSAINGLAPGASPRITPGDDVTYCLSYTLPAADFENLQLTAYLPLPIFSAVDPDSNGVSNPFTLQGGAFDSAPGVGQYSYRAIGGDGSGTAAPTVTANGVSNALTFDFGTRADATTGTLTIEICYTARASNQPFADGLFLTTQAGSGSSSTGLVPIASNAITQILVTEPVVSMQKGAVGDDVIRATSTFDPVYTPSNPTGLVRPAGDASANPLLATITSASALNLNDNISAVDGGDNVRFAIVLTNSGSSSRGAFDVRVSDVLPSNIDASTLANLRIVRGDGTAVGFQRVGGGAATINDLFGVGIELIDAPGQGAIGGTRDASNNPTAPGSNLVIITYDAKVLDAVAANSSASSSATLFNYAGSEGGVDHTTVDLTEAAQVVTAPPAIDKQIIATDRAYTSLASGHENVVIGEIVTYQVTLTIPEGTNANAQFVDTLDRNLSITELVSATSSAGVSFTNPLAGFMSVVPTDAGGGSANRITFDFGTVTNTNTNNAATETITLVYRAVVSNVSGNQVNVQRSNTAALNSDAGSISAQAPYVVVVEPNIAVSLTPDLTSADAGDTVTFTLTLTSNGGSPAYDVGIADLIPAGMTYVPASLSQTGGPVASSLTMVGSSLSGTWSQIDPGTPVTLSFQVTLDNGVAIGQSLSQTADAEWSSIPGGASNLSPYTAIGDGERTGVDGVGGVNDYVASGTAAVTVVTPVPPLLTLIQTSEPASISTNVAVGEILRYRMVMALPEATALDFRVNPVLPAGLRFLNDGTSTLSFVTDDAGGGITSSTLSGAGLDQTGSGLLPTDISAVVAQFAIPGSAIVDATGTPIAAGPMTAGAEPVFRLGDLVNLDRDTNREFVVIEFNAVVDNRTGVINAATAPVQFGYETGGFALGNSNTVTTTVVEPIITSMDKRVLSVTGNQVTYQVTFTNTGTESAQDVRLTDPFGGAVNQSFNGAGGVTLTTVPPGTVDNSTASGLDVSIPVLGVGQSVTVRYTATIPDITIATPARNATVVYSSLTEGAGGGKTLDVTTTTGTVTSNSTGERTGNTADYGGALNVYSKLDPAGLGVISGRLWDDTTDYNSLFTGSDTGLAGRTVTLTWAGSDNVFGNGDDQAFTVSTASDGSYVSGAMPAGNYRITTAASFTDGTLGKLNVFNDGGASGSKVDGLITLTLADAGSASAQNFIYVQQNDAPVASVGPARSIIEEVATSFGGADLISVTDPDAGASTNNQVALSVLHGNLNVTGAGTAVIGGNGSGSLTITGSLTDINATLATLSYLNTLNYNGADTLTVTVNDRGNTGDANGNGIPNELVGDNLQHVQTVNLTVTGVNDPPVAQNDLRTTDENTTINGQAITPTVGQQAAGDVTDTDPDTPYGDVISVQGVVAGNVGGVQTANVGVAVVGTYGALTLGNNGIYSYVPGPAAQALPAGALVSDVFTYTIRDTAGVTATATISIAINGVNDPVAAAADARSMFEDDPPITGNAVRGNGVAGGQPGDVLDPDPDGDTVAVQGVQAGNTAAVLSTGVGAAISGSYGSLVLNGDGTYTYTQDSRVQALAAGQSVNEVFSYTVNDSHGTTANTTITIVISGRNDPPVANSDARTTDQNTPITGHVMSPNVAQQTAGDVTDTDPDLPGGDVITVQGAAAGVVAGPVSGGLGVAGVGGTWGHLNLYPDGTYQYQPGPLAQTLPAGAVVTDVFTYTITDSSGSTSTATITITVNGLNNPVVAVPDIRSTIEDAPPISGNVVAGNGVAGGQPGDAADPDPDGDLITAGGVQAGSTAALLNSGIGLPILGNYGSLILNANGTYTYTQDSRAQGLAQGQVIQDVFSYTIGDPTGSRATTTLTINVFGQNDLPIAIDDLRSTDEDTTITGQLLSPTLAQQVLGDMTDTDPDLVNGDVISVQGVAPGAAAGPLGSGVGGPGVDGIYGHLIVNNDGSYSYVPGAAAQALPAGAVVQDVFTYTIRDLNGATSTARLTITVNGLNDGPVAVPDANSIVTDAVAPSTGNVIAAGSVTDAPDSESDVGDTLTVQGVVAGTSGGPLAGSVGAPLAGAYGSLVLQPDGSYAYTLDPNNPVVLAMLPGQTLTDVFSYTINDGNGGAATTSLTITIRGVFDPPQGQDKTFMLLEDTPQPLSASDFGFSDPDLGDTMQAVRIDTLPSSGSMLLNGVGVTAGQIIPFAQLGNLSYVAANNANDQNLPASPQFRFSVQDSSGLFDLVPNTINFLISPVNDPPTAPSLTTTIDASAVLGSSVSNVLGLGAPTDPDLPAQTLTVQINSIPDPINGTFYTPDRIAVTPGMHLSPAQLQNLSFVPNPANPNPASALTGLVPSGSLMFTMQDGQGGAADGVININVRPIPPTLTPSGFPPTSNAPASLTPGVRSDPVVGPASSSTSVHSDTPRPGSGEHLRTALAGERSNRALDSLNLSQLRTVSDFEPLLVGTPALARPSIAKDSVEEKTDASKSASAQDCDDKGAGPPAPKPKAVRSNVFASKDGILLPKPKTFSEQIRTAQKRFKPPAKLPVRRDSQPAC